VTGLGHLFRGTLMHRLKRPDSPYQVVALHAKNGSHEDLAAEFPEAKRAVDFEAMCADPDIEAIWILSPADTHFAYASAALQAGKSVYVQKPAAGSGDEVERLAELERPGVCCIAAPVQMAYPAWQRVREELGLDSLGPLYTVLTSFMGWGGSEIGWPSHPGWRFAAGNGPLPDHGIYTITFLVGLLGPAVSVMAMGGVRQAYRTWNGQRFPVDEIDNLAAIIEFADGVYATLSEAWAATDGTYDATFHGLEGTVVARAALFDASPNTIVVTDTWGTELRRWDIDSSPELAGFFRNGFSANEHVWADVLHLAECMRGTAEPLGSLRQVLPVYRVMDAIQESVRTGRRAGVPQN
jgi:predicted dehydrogenase